MFEIIMTIITFVLLYKFDAKDCEKRWRDKNNRTDMFGNRY